MEFTPVVAVAVGAALTYVAQWTTERRVIKRADVKAQADALGNQRAAWRVFQVENISDLQEQMEAIAAWIAVELTDPSRLQATDRRADTGAALMPFGRANMLTFRLQDEALGVEVRRWLEDVRVAVHSGDFPQEYEALRRRRIALQERLGGVLRSHHPV